MKTKLNILITAALSAVLFTAPLTADIDTREASQNRANYNWTAQSTIDHAEAIMASDDISAWDLRYVVLQRSEGTVFLTGQRVDDAADLFTEAELDHILDVGSPYSRAFVLIVRENYDVAAWEDANAFTGDMFWYFVWQDSIPANLQQAGMNQTVGNGHAGRTWVRAFKAYRSRLPHAEQVAFTRDAKDGLIAVPNRNSAQDRWLTEVSADLMALQLDQ